jgi:hypothetical protein
VALVANPAFFGATSGDGAPTVSMGSAAAVAGSTAGTSACAVSALIDPPRGSETCAAAARSPRPWMAFQMRLVAIFRFVNFVTGLNRNAPKCLCFGSLRQWFHSPYTTP